MVIHCKILKCVCYSEQVLAVVIAALYHSYCPHEREGFDFFPHVNNSPFKTSGVCIPHPYIQPSSQQREVYFSHKGEQSE